MYLNRDSRVCRECIAIEILNSPSGLEILDPGLSEAQLQTKLWVIWWMEQSKCNGCKVLHENADMISAYPCVLLDCNCTHCNRKYQKVGKTRESNVRPNLLYCGPCYQALQFVCKTCLHRFNTGSCLHRHLDLAGHHV